MIHSKQAPRSQVCVVYDEVTGDICHSHRFVTLEGARYPDSAAIRDVALGFAKARGYSLDRLHVMSVSENALRGERQPRVDVLSRALVFNDPAEI